MYIQINEQEKKKIEEETRGQGSSEEWGKQRKGRITASIAHEAMTKTDYIIRKRGARNPKYTPLVNKIINGVDISGVDAVKWGKKHEADALRQFMAVITSQHDCKLGSLKSSTIATFNQ